MDMDMDMDGKFHIHGNPGHLMLRFAHTVKNCLFIRLKQL